MAPLCEQPHGSELGQAHGQWPTHLPIVQDP